MNRRRAPLIRLTCLLAGASVCLALLGLGRLAIAASPHSLLPKSFLIVVQGLAGEDFYAQSFARNSDGLVDIARARWGVPKEHIIGLRPKPQSGERRSNRAEVLAVLEEIKARSSAGDRIMFVYFGHISAHGAAPKFNLPGPDLTDSDLAAKLNEIRDRQVAVVLAAASSGAMLQTLSASRRIVVTATASGREKYAPRFGEYFVASWIAPDADSDKDGIVNLYEVFEHTRRAVREAFEKENRLLTEHALLDDNGDGQSSKKVLRAAAQPEVESELDDGLYARRFSFQFDTERRADSADQLGLTLRARQLAQAVESLRRERSQMAPDAYRQRLEGLLVELALNRRRQRETLRR